MSHLLACLLSEKRGLLDLVFSNSFFGTGESVVECRQNVDLILLWTAWLKQKKAAGVGSDGLHQFKYTPEQYRPRLFSVFQSV